MAFAMGRNLGESVAIYQAFPARQNPGQTARAASQACNVAEHNDLALQRNPHYLTYPAYLPVLFDGPIALPRATHRQQAFGAESARCCTSYTRATPMRSRPSRAWRPRSVT